MIDRIANWLERNKGAPVMIGVLLVIINLVLQPLGGLPYVGWIFRFHVLLHVGIIVGLIGILVGDAL